MALDGRSLLVCEGSQDRGTELRAELTRGGARTALALLGERSTESIVAESIEELGSIDGVVLRLAGPTAAIPLAQLSLAEWEARVVQPLRTTTLLFRDVVGHWLGEGEGGSLIVLHESGDGATAAALQSGLEALVRSVAKEYGRRRVRCNLLVLSSTADAPSIARLVDLVLSPAFGFVTGQVLATTRRHEPIS